ncbi:MAG: dockerin type I repeat-containing protein [Clostridia bacterium]|nr:dockerin type I repeat-containing protein [Clostridia bacterium]
MKKVISVILAIAMIFSICGLYSYAAGKKIQSLKIVTKPTKVDFYKDTDWVYGTWTDVEGQPGKYKLVPSTKYISFTYNPCGGIYPERGMIDMRGLKIEVVYTDGTKETMTYTETKNKMGFYNANILVSPKDGKEFFIGANTMEVYLKGDPYKFDSYKINIHGETAPPAQAKTGDVNGDKKVNSSDALMIQQYIVGIISLSADQQKLADMNGDKKINSNDALLVLQSAVK